MDRTDVLDAIASYVLEKGNGWYRKDVAPSSANGPYLHGPGGMFGTPGLNRDVISTRVQPKGLLDMLPVRGTTYTNPLYPYITGFLAASGSNPTGVCDDPQTAGPAKTCIQTATFGRYSYQTRAFELNRVGQQTNRGEFMDLTLVNPIISGDSGISSPASAQGWSFLDEVRLRTTEVGVAFQNKLVRQLYTGNPTNNTSGNGYEEFPGLDILIGTTKVDAITGTPCPSLHSDIKDFNYAMVNAAGGNTIVNVLTYMMRMLRWNAERMNFGDVEWIIAMRPQLWNELTAVWPCAYMTYRCEANTVNTQTQLVVNSNDQIAMRDDMRNGMYLLVDGIRYRVALDDGIVEENRADNATIPITGFASDIYVIPRTIRNGTMAATFVEHLDYSADNGLMSSAREIGAGFADTFYWTDGGRYAWHRKPPNNWCVQWMAKIEPRVILLTPHLAGRITNVAYNPLQHERDSIIGDDYFVDGGVQNRAPGRLYSDWNSSTPA